MRRFFSLFLAALTMAVVALVSAFVAMRVAIHGREGTVPQLVAVPLSDAEALAAQQGLHLNLEDRFYSTEVPAGRVLSQEPGAGSVVRRDWPVRVTVSLGAQAVNIPDLTGEPERTASVAARRLGLDPGVTAYLPAPGDSGVVLAQSPPSGSAAAAPRVSLLVSEPAEDARQAWVMPSLIGLSYGSAVARAASADLRVVLAVDPTAAPAGTAGAATAPGQAGVVGAQGSAGGTGAGATPPSPMQTPAAPGIVSGVVAGQYPAPGRRVLAGDVVHVTLATPSGPAAAAPSP